MAILGALFGTTLGVVVKLWSNSLGKQRYLARPWRIVTWGIVGGYVGYNLDQWEKKLLANVNAERKAQGFAEITRAEIIPDIPTPKI